MSRSANSSNKQAEATGYSQSFSFEEALRNAIEFLPAVPEIPTEPVERIKLWKPGWSAAVSLDSIEYLCVFAASLQCLSGFANHPEAASGNPVFVFVIYGFTSNTLPAPVPPTSGK